MSFNIYVEYLIFVSIYVNLCSTEYITSDCCMRCAYAIHVYISGVPQQIVRAA